MLVGTVVARAAGSMDEEVTEVGIADALTKLRRAAKMRTMRLENCIVTVGEVGK
jgi:hypothetical protein